MTARARSNGLTRVDKPWGWELWWAHTERYVGKILHINRGEALSYQFHRKKDETIYLLHGTLDLELAPPRGRRRRRRLTPGHAVHIKPGDRHRMTAVTTCDVLEASTPEVDDVVRLEDQYGRLAGPAPVAARGRTQRSAAAKTSRARRVR